MLNSLRAVARTIFRRHPVGRPANARRRMPTFRPQVCGLEDRAVMSATVLVNDEAFALTGSGPSRPDAQHAAVRLTVTADAPGHEGLYLWEYQVTSVDFGSWEWYYDYGADFVDEFGLDTAVPLADVGSDGVNSGSVWSYFGPLLPGDPAAEFRFTTPAVPIVSVAASLSETDGGGASATGTVKGPGATVPEFDADHDSTIFSYNSSGSSSGDITPNDQDSSLVANGAAAPVSTVQNMDQIAAQLVADNGSVDAANAEMLKRATVIGNKVIYPTVEDLQSDAIKNKLRYGQVPPGVTKNGKPWVAGFYMWGQNITLPNYTGTVLQKIEITKKAWGVGGGNPITETSTAVEGFFLKNGRTNLDLQTTRLDFNPAVTLKGEMTVTLTLGAGTYNGQGVNGFSELEKKHVGGMTGNIVWAGATTTVQFKITLDNQGRTTFTGPWGN